VVVVGEVGEGVYLSIDDDFSAVTGLDGRREEIRVPWQNYATHDYSSNNYYCTNLVGV